MIHIIGNSHVTNFSGQEKHESINGNYIGIDDRFKMHHLGPVIAYNFLESHMSKVNQIINDINKNEDYITLIVGEVDCRLHLPLQADSQNRTDEDVVKECVERLFVCYDQIIGKGYKVFCVGTHPTTTEGHDMRRDDRPIYGSMERRNNICVMWNDNLKKLSLKRNIPFIDIYEYLVDENNNTKMEYFKDYCHLNSYKVINYYLEELKKYKIL